VACAANQGVAEPIKELSSAAGPCAGRGCALIRQLANWNALFKISARWWPVTTTFCLGQCRLITDVAMEAPSHRTWFVRSASAPRRSAEIYTVYVRRKFHCRVAGRSDASRPASAQACPGIRPVPPRVRSRPVCSIDCLVGRRHIPRIFVPLRNCSLERDTFFRLTARNCRQRLLSL